jgi:hypothetical protein
MSENKPSIASFIHKTLHKIYGEGIEIIDAKIPLRLQPIRLDCIGAEPKNPLNCVLVHTANRMFGSKAVLFFKSTAWIDLISPEDNVRRVERFLVTPSGFQHILNLDSGKPFKEGTAIILKPPHPSRQLENKRKYDSRYRQTPIGRLVLQHQVAKGQVKKAAIEYDKAVEKYEQAQENLSATSPKLIEAKQQRLVAKKTLEKTRLNLATVAEKLKESESKKNIGKRGTLVNRRKARRFDLRTRNGAIGHYNITNGEN